MKLVMALLALIAVFVCLLAMFVICAAVASIPGFAIGALVSGQNRSARSALVRHPRFGWFLWFTAAAGASLAVALSQADRPTSDVTPTFVSMALGLIAFVALQWTSFYIGFGVRLRRRARHAAAQQNLPEVLAIGHTDSEEDLMDEVFDDNGSDAIAPIIVPGRAGDGEDTTTQEIPVLTPVVLNDEEYPSARPTED